MTMRKSTKTIAMMIMIDMLALIAAAAATPLTAVEARQFSPQFIQVGYHSPRLVNYTLWILWGVPAKTSTH